MCVCVLTVGDNCRRPAAESLFRVARIMTSQASSVHHCQTRGDKTAQSERRKIAGENCGGQLERLKK